MGYDEKIDILQEMLKYIDLHIKEELNVEILAERSGFSPYYFCRGFKWGVGISIMEYVRNRRLAYAASELKSGRKILDIAADYGFETHSGFSKAFRRFFGCPPEIYRTYASFNVPDIPDLTKSSNFTSECVIEPKILAKKTAFKLAGYALKMGPENILSGIGFLEFRNKCKTDGRMEKLHREPFVKYHSEYGACFYSVAKSDESVYIFKDDESVYLFGVEVKARHTIPAEYHVYTIPETIFAVFTTLPGNDDNFPAKTKDAWDFIFSEWLPNSGYEFNFRSTAFELYDDRSTGTAEKVCDIYIPIINRKL